MAEALQGPLLPQFFASGSGEPLPASGTTPLSVHGRGTRPTVDPWTGCVAEAHSSSSGGISLYGPAPTPASASTSTTTSTDDDDDDPNALRFLVMLKDLDAPRGVAVVPGHLVRPAAVAVPARVARGKFGESGSGGGGSGSGAGDDDDDDDDGDDDAGNRRRAAAAAAAAAAGHASAEQKEKVWQHVPGGSRAAEVAGWGAVGGTAAWPRALEPVPAREIRHQWIRTELVKRQQKAGASKQDIDAQLREIQDAEGPHEDDVEGGDGVARLPAPPEGASVVVIAPCNGSQVLAFFRVWFDLDAAAMTGGAHATDPEDMGEYTDFETPASRAAAEAGAATPAAGPRVRVVLERVLGTGVRDERAESFSFMQDAAGCVSPSGAAWVVVSDGANNRIQVVDVDSYTLVRTIPTRPYGWPWQIVVDPRTDAPDSPGWPRAIAACDNGSRSFSLRPTLVTAGCEDPEAAAAQEEVEEGDEEAKAPTPGEYKDAVPIRSAFIDAHGNIMGKGKVQGPTDIPGSKPLSIPASRADVSSGTADVVVDDHHGRVIFFTSSGLVWYNLGRGATKSARKR